MARYTAEALERSDDGPPVEGTIEVAVPVRDLWEWFSRPELWSHWNPCFFRVRSGDLAVGRRLVWAFQPIRRRYLYKLPATATIVEVEPQSKVTWEVTALPGFFARHTYFMEDAGGGRTRFGSYEKAMGWSFRLLKRFWLAHFRFVLRSSLEGARQLEAVFLERGKIDDATLRQLGGQSGTKDADT